jgi:hypothetical protein
MKRLNLPPLEVGRPYVTSDFEWFEYCGGALSGEEPILRLHLKNGTTLDLPTTEEELNRLLFVLIDAFGPKAIEHLKERRWIDD